MKLRRDIFQAISDPTRRAILVLLTSQSMTAGAIANNFEAARPTISKHIQILSECNLLKSNQQGREIYYELKVDKFKEIDSWLAHFRAIWEARFETLDSVLTNLKDPQNEQK